MRFASAIVLLAFPAAAQYTYYFTDPFPSINTVNWQANGVISGSASGLVSSDSAGGSVISKLAVPGGLPAHEVNMRVRLSAAGGTYVQYLRASLDARTGPSASGTFYSVEWGNVTFTGNGGCTMQMKINQRVGGVFTTLGSSSVGCIPNADNYMIAVITWHGHILASINGIGVAWLDTGSAIASGQPGAGLLAAPPGNSIGQVKLGPPDTTPPAQLDTRTVDAINLPNEVNLRWQSVNDGPSGVGVYQYFVYRDGQWLTSVMGSSLSDSTVSPGTAYTYSIAACDRHANCQSAVNIVVQTPAAGFAESRRTGVASHGAYWGAAGENIDVFSGNLNYSIPLSLRRKAGPGCN